MTDELTHRPPADAPENAPVPRPGAPDPEGGEADEQPPGSAPHGEDARPGGPGRPTITKHLAGERVILPPGHARGEEMSFGQVVMYWLTWVVVSTTMRVAFRARVRGREHVPAAGPFIISPVHRSDLDTPLVSLVMRGRMRFMGKESLWKRRFTAWYFTAAGGFPVERATADRRALNACLEVLDRGEPLVLFPEGTKLEGPVVAEMFDGAAWLACRAQCPILPVGIGGSARALPKGAKLPRPTKVTLVIGEPIAPPPPTAAGRTSRRAVRELSTELRSRLQELFDEAQERAGTPNIRP